MPEDISGLGALRCYPDRHAIAMEVAFAVDFKFDFDLWGLDQSGISPFVGMGWGKILQGVLGMSTIQFVAVMGMREKSQPDCAWRSEVRRMYLGDFQNVSAWTWSLEVVLVCSYYCVFSKFKVPALHVGV